MARKWITTRRNRPISPCSILGNGVTDQGPSRRAGGRTDGCAADMSGGGATDNCSRRRAITRSCPSGGITRTENEGSQRDNRNDYETISVHK